MPSIQIPGHILLAAAIVLSPLACDHSFRESTAEHEIDTDTLRVTDAEYSLPSLAPPGRDARRAIQSSYEVPRLAIEEVGVLQEPKELVFGRIVDIVDTSDEAIAVLDSRFNDVRIIDQGGELVDRFGGPGRGPSEFAAPRALGSLADSRLGVLDRRVGRVSIFNDNGGEFEFSHDVILNHRAHDLCGLGDRFVVSGLDSKGNGFHIYSSMGDKLGEATALYFSEHPIVSRQLNQTLVACPEGGDEFYALATRTGEVYSISTSGEVRWGGSFDEFNAARMSISSSGSLTSSLADADRALHYGISIVAPRPGVLLVQHAERTADAFQEGLEYDGVVSYLVDENGGVISTRRDIPVVHDVGQKVWFGSKVVPFPKVVFIRGIQESTEHNE